MIDDSVIRRIILTHIPALAPWRIEMEGIDFGERVGVFLRLESGVHRIAVDAFSKRGGPEKSEDRIAFELSQQIRKILKADNVGSNA